MSKTIKTIQSSEKNEFDRIINSHVENGWELVDGSYSIINDNVYSQVIVNKVLYNTILYHNNGEISCMKNYKEGNNDGKEILYYKNKNIFWVKNYIDGKEDGMFINYYKDGRVFSINHLINDEEHGQYIEYFNNGQKSFEGNYNYGLQHGESKYYYWNGKIHIEQNFNNGIKEGLFIEYYLNGKVKKDFLFSNDIIVSEKYYDENGGPNITFSTEDCSANISYSNIINDWEGEGIIEGEGVIDLDPLFTDPENNDFSLQTNSPCIDAGDPESTLDPDGTIADMGALYFDQSPSYSLGDLNQDGSIDILDVVITVGIILGDEPTEWEFYAGDLNTDGLINVLDIVQLVNLILQS